MDLIIDPIVEEVRKARSDHSERFNNSVDDIIKDIQGRQKKYGERLVRRSPKVRLRKQGPVSIVQ